MAKAAQDFDPFAEEVAAPARIYPAESHDEIDALVVERNAAVAEAKLWLRRLLQLQQERDQAAANLHECNKRLEEWIAAYNDLLTKFHRIETAYEIEKDCAETSNFLIERLQPLAVAKLKLLADEASR